MAVPIACKRDLILAGAFFGLFTVHSMTTSIVTRFWMHEDPDSSAPQTLLGEDNFTKRLFSEENFIDPQLYHFIGGALAPILAGYYVLNFSATHVFGAMVLLASIANLLINPALIYQNIPLMKFVFFINGIAESSLYPAAFSILAQWTTPDARLEQVAIVISGTYAGDLFGQLVGIYVAHMRLFYINVNIHSMSGFLLCIYLAFTSTLSTKTDIKITNMMPHYHYEAAISAHNLAMEESRRERQTFLRPPWRAILTSKAVLILCYSRLIFYLLYHSAPMFTDRLLNGGSEPTISRLLCRLLIVVVAGCSGLTAIWLRDEQYMKTPTSFRRFFVSSGLALEALLLVWISNSLSIDSAIMLLTVAVGCSGWTLPSLQVNAMEIAPKYVGIVSGLSAMVAYLAGFASKAISFYVATPDLSDENATRPTNFVFVTLTILLTSASVLFAIAGRADRQPWDEDDYKPMPAVYIEHKLPFAEDNPAASMTSELPVQMNIEPTLDLGKDIDLEMYYVMKPGVRAS